MSHPVRWSILVAMLVLSVGCAKLPDYAAPRMSLGNEAGDPVQPSTDVIAYRDLRRADFRGTSPPEGRDARLAAVTCLRVKPLVDDLETEFVPSGDYGRTRIYNVTLHNLRYRALMDRECSWWNPDNSGQKDGYILEHEQIHFALFEIAARRWTRLPPLQFRIQVDTSDAMQQNLLNQFRTHFRKLLEQLNRRQYQFDVDTSVGYDPEKQRAWLEQVESELVETDPLQ